MKAATIARYGGLSRAECAGRGVVDERGFTGQRFGPDKCPTNFGPPQLPLSRSQRFSPRVSESILEP
jgi:hypothetical protein